MTEPVCVCNDSFKGHWFDAYPNGRRVPELEAIRSVDGVTIWQVLDPHQREQNLKALADFMQRYPAARVICLSPVPALSEAVEALRCGARGYCHAYLSAARLWQVGEVVELGGLYLGPELQARIMKSLAPALQARTSNVADEAAPEAQDAGASPAGSGSGAIDAGWTATLSAREREVAEAICEGLTNREIAERLCVTERTVKAHLSALFEKCAVRDRLQLVIKLAPTLRKS